MKLIPVFILLLLTSCTSTVPTRTGPASLQIVPPEYYYPAYKRNIPTIIKPKQNRDQKDREEVKEQEKTNIPSYPKRRFVPQNKENIHSGSDTSIEELENKSEDLQEAIRSLNYIYSDPPRLP